MDASLEHRKDPAVGWNILASAKADNNEKISRVEILVNGFSKYDQSFRTPITQWKHELTQQGQFPGDNTTELKVTNDKGESSVAQDSWSGIDA